VENDKNVNHHAVLLDPTSFRRTEFVLTLLQIAHATVPMHQFLRLFARLSSYILFAGLLLSPAVTQAQPNRNASNWSPEDYRALSAVDDEDWEEDTFEGDEKLDRIEKNAETQLGSYSLRELLDLPTYDQIQSSLDKIDRLEGERALLEGELGGALQSFGLRTREEADPDDEDERPDPEEQDEGGSDGNFRVVSSGFLEVDLEGQVVVSEERAVVNFGGNRLTADRMVIDVKRREIQASGDVVFEDLESGSFITGDALVYDFGRQTGWMNNALGQQGVVSLVQNPDGSGLETFEQINERTVVFNESSVTTDNFPKPMYRLRGSEIIFMPQDRFIILHAILYIRELPVMYFPLFTRSIGEDPIPWSLKFGVENGGARELGAYSILTYDYNYEVVEPSLERPDEFEQLTRSRISPSIMLSEPTQAFGLEGSYDVQNATHKGDFQFFYSPGHQDREDTLLEGGDDSRFIYDFQHRTQLSENLDLLVNTEWVSDSEAYVDYFDEIYPEFARGRVAERRFQTALTWTRDDYLARVKYEVKERIGRNRINNYGEPGDDDSDYDQFVLDPPLAFEPIEEGLELEEEQTPLDLIGPNNELLGGSIQVAPEDEELDAIEPPDDVDTDEEQIPEDRFGKVTERKPEFNFTTSRLPIFSKPIYWTLDIRAFNNLDKGLNNLDTGDDSFVKGFDIYNSFVNVINFSEQYSWYNQVGFGIGRAARDDTSLDLLRGSNPVFPARLTNGLTFIDEETFIIGTEPISIGDAEETFFYYDLESVLDAQFSEKFTGRFRYRYREGTEDSLAETYTRIGATETREDLFDFRLRQHRIDASFVYDFIYPRLRLTLDAGYNLDGDDDLTINETISQVTSGIEWTSLNDEWTLSANTSWVRGQVRDPSDINAYESSVLISVAQIDYFPLHERYWAQIQGSFFKELEEDPADDFIAENALDPNLGDDERFTDDGVRWEIEPVFGFRAGPKWEIEAVARYDEEEEDIDRARLIFQRDINDATLAFGIIWDLTTEDDGLTDREREEEALTQDDDREREREMEFEFGVAFKLPNRDRFSGELATETIVNQRRSEIELGG
jgi:hypothetical protein